MNDLPDRVGRIETLISEIEASANAGTLEQVRELLDVLLEMYGATLERLLEAAYAGGGQKAVDDVSRDELVGSVLLLHGLHPRSRDARVEQALESVRPYLQSHGGDVELLGVVDDGTVRLSLHGSCNGCPSSAATLKYAIEEAVHSAAPDVLRIDVIERTEQAAEGGGETLEFIPMSEVVTWEDCPFPIEGVQVP